MMGYLERIFKLKESNTTIKTELLAGLTTFFTMSYLFVLSPKILSTTGLDYTTTLTITAILIFLCSTLMGLYANKPYAVAPFLGEKATDQDIQNLFTEAVKILKIKYPNITVRLLDNRIWNKLSRYAK